MSFLKSAKAWMGLDEPEYQDTPQGTGVEPLGESVQPVPTAVPEQRPEQDFSAVRSLGPVGDSGPISTSSPAVDLAPLSNTSLKPVGVPERGEQAIGTVQPVPATVGTKPQLVVPRTFDDAEDFGDRLRSGVPILLNLKELDKAMARRILDFCSGLCYGLRAKMDRAGSGVFLLIPADIQLSADDYQAVRDSGLTS